MGFMEADHPLEIHIKDIIRRQQQEGLRQLLPHFEKCPRVSHGGFFLEIAQAHPKAGSVAQGFPNLIPLMGNRQDDIRDPLAGEIFDFPLQHRLAPDHDQGLGDIRKKVGDTRPLAAGHYNRFHQAVFLRTGGRVRNEWYRKNRSGR